jgi:hypothetical protein
MKCAKAVAANRHCGLMHEPSLASLANLSLVAARAYRYGSQLDSLALELQLTECTVQSS